MSHSKRNTSLAYFTAHERSQLRSTWGSQSTRLTRESFLPFGFCRLCLGYARDPVTCGGDDDILSEEGRSGGNEVKKAGAKKEAPKVHLFCRECALNDLMAQRKEIKRLEKEASSRERDEVDGRVRDEEERQRRDLERFERHELGFEDGDAHKKRKREAEETHARQTTDHQEDADTNKKHKKTSEASFWTPGSESTSANTTAAANKSKPQPSKTHPLCPASIPHSQHTYALKSLVSVKFTTVQNDSDASKTEEASLICPSCKKALTNTSRPMLGTAEGCGHVVCGSCADLFLKGGGGVKNGPSSSKQNGQVDVNIQCFVCEANLSGRPQETEAGERQTARNEEKQIVGKSKSKKSTTTSKVGRLVEISCEGTGFAGGGANMAKREGVVFQC